MCLLVDILSLHLVMKFSLLKKLKLPNHLSFQKDPHSKWILGIIKQRYITLICHPQLSKKLNLKTKDQSQVSQIKHLNGFNQLKTHTEKL